MTFNAKAFLNNSHKVNASPADQAGDIVDVETVLEAGEEEIWKRILNVLT